ncbi:MAG: hypothetical protein WAT68_10320 [Candidatus Nitrotoga sp.]
MKPEHIFCRKKGAKCTQRPKVSPSNILYFSSLMQFMGIPIRMLTIFLILANIAENTQAEEVTPVYFGMYAFDIKKPSVFYCLDQMHLNRILPTQDVIVAPKIEDSSRSMVKAISFPANFGLMSYAQMYPDNKYFSTIEYYSIPFVRNALVDGISHPINAWVTDFYNWKIKPNVTLGKKFHEKNASIVLVPEPAIQAQAGLYYVVFKSLASSLEWSSAAVIMDFPIIRSLIAVGRLPTDGGSQCFDVVYKKNVDNWSKYIVDKVTPCANEIQGSN